MSNLTKTLAVVSLLAPVTAQPLGIGDIQLHSALNQKLNAEIKLQLAGENPADISVRLAPPEKFDQAGVAWNYVLSKLKFEPVTQANGSVVVKVTSREALTEPFLDFLLEVSWPQGSLFREFTLLLDPPADYQPSTPTMPTASASGGYDFGTALEAYERPAKKARSGKRAAKAESNITPDTPSSGEYGPVQAQDTLWNIADKLGNERNVPTKQMLNALYRANPNAFNHSDINSLKTGTVLKIPETAAILQGSAEQKLSSAAERKEAVTAAKAATVPSSKALELVAPTDAKIEEHAEVGSQAKSGPDAKGAAAASLGDSASKVRDAELQARIEKLEQQLNMMQQLLALKDEQLASLQNKEKPVPQSTATTPAVPKVEPPQQPTVAIPPATPQTTAPAATTQPPATQAPAQPAVTPKPKPAKAPKPAPQPPKEDSSQTYVWTVGGISAGILGVLGWLWWRKRKIEEQTNTESMFASASQIKMPDADSTLSVPVMEMSSAGSYDVGTVGESSFISDFTPSDFDAFDTDQNEVDPMSEADVYLAYGRYQQAEDLIRNAIKDQPDRDEYKLKLLEILYANESKESFAAYAEELADAGKQSDRPFWSKVADMGKEIVPESILFGGTATAIEALTSEDETAFAPKESTTPTSAAKFDLPTEPASTNHAHKLNDDLIDLNAPTLPDMALMDDINSELAELQLTSEEPLQADDNSLDFDLSSFTDSGAGKKGEDTTAPANIETIDFDLSGLSLDNAPSADDKPSTEDKTENSLESFDFNFDVATPDFSDQKKSETGRESSGEPLDLASLESFEFPDFESGSETAQTATDSIESLKLTETSTDNIADEFDFNFDFEVPTGDSAAKDEIDLGVADLTDMDEYETKIDLAKAYIDMGDTETAKTIAEEILEKGNKDQKIAAQALLDELK